MLDLATPTYTLPNGATVYDIPQHDADGVANIEWLTLRAGKVTGSRMKDVLDVTAKGLPSAKRTAYLWQLVQETLTGKAAPAEFVNDAMRWGTATEPFAAIQYGTPLEHAGLIIHPTIDRLAYSPDGLVGEDGLWEAKCPTTTTMLQWLMAGVIPEQHLPQLNLALAVTGREWIDFMAYDPRLPEGFDRMILRHHADAKAIETVEQEAVKFLAEVDSTVAALRDRF